MNHRSSKTCEIQMVYELEACDEGCPLNSCNRFLLQNKR